jgi:hypothetical protein
MPLERDNLWTESECVLAVSLMRENNNYKEIEDHIRELRNKEQKFQELKIIKINLKYKEQTVAKLESEIIKLKDIIKKHKYDNNETFIILNDQVAILKEHLSVSKEESENKTIENKTLEFKNEKLEKVNTILIQNTKLQHFSRNYINIQFLNTILLFPILIYIYYSCLT